METRHPADQTRPNKRYINQAANRQHIIDAATILFHQVGYEDATIRAIAKRAGLSTGAIFSNFKDKADLWTHITKLPPPADGSLYRASRDMLTTLVKAAEQFRFYEQQHREKAGLPSSPGRKADTLRKADVNARFATEIEALVQNATTPLPFEKAHAG